MLQRAVVAVAADEPKALSEFAHGQAGFRTADTYVFCVGPDGTMTAHPNPSLQGQDVRDLHDQTGNHFIATMLETARPGQISEVRYMFPRPGGTVETPKTTYYTRIADQVCGVGVYDSEVPDAPPTPKARLAQIQARLSAGMPPNLKADWTAFLKAMDEDRAAQDAAFTKARDQVRAAETVLAASVNPGKENSPGR